MDSRLAKLMSLFGILFLGWYGIFALPYSFSFSTPVASDSYNVGFSNKVAVMVVAGVIGLLYLRLVAFRERANRVGLLFRRSIPSMTMSLLSPGWGVLVLFCMLYICLEILVGLGAPRLDVYGGESWSFIKRIELMLHGVRPYSELEVPYGPVFMHLPAAFAWFGAKLGFPVGQSYLFYLALVHVLGLLCLHCFINAMRLNANIRMVIFAFVASVFALGALSLGLQYTVLRFITPYALLVCLHKWVEKHDGTSSGNIVSQSTTAFFLALIGLAISPEIGLVTIGSQLVYFGVKILARPRSVYPLFATLLSLPMCMAVFSADYLRAVLAFGSGGGAFPVVPSVFIIFYLGCLFWSVPMIVRYAWRERQDQSRYLLMALAAANVLFLPAALGRCDPGHVLFNGAGTIVVTAALAWCCHPRKFSLFIVGLLLVSLLLTITVISHGRTQVEYAMTTLSKTPLPRETTTSPLISELGLDQYESVGVPFDIDPDMERYLRQRGKYIPGYYIAAWEVTTRKDVTRKLDYLRKANVILVTSDVTAFKDVWQVDRYLASEAYIRELEKNQKNFLSTLQLYPVHYRIVNTPFSPYFEVMKYIAQNYVPIKTAGRYVLMQPKTNP